MKRLSANLSYKSLTQLLKDIEDYQKNWLPRKVDEFASELAKVGRDEASRLYSQGGGSPIPPDVTVTAVKLEDGKYAIVANGTQVCFLEFGAGVYATSSHPYSSEVPFEVYPGSYSENHGHTFEDWLNSNSPNKGEYKFNTVPTRALLSAYNEMVRRSREVAQKVFKNG